MDADKRKLFLGMKSLTVDPGLTGTGWALWNNLEDGLGPVRTGTIQPQGSFLPYRLKRLFQAVAKIVARERVKFVVVEWPLFYGTAKGRVSAETGDLIKLTAAAATVGAAAVAKFALVEHVTAPEWKGSLPKDVAKKWIQEEFPDFAKNLTTSHEYDAVGIGLFYKGLWA